MKRWLWLALAGLGVYRLLVLGRPEAGRDADSYPCLARWGRSVSSWGEPALASPPAVPAQNREPRQAPPTVFESLAVDSLLLIEREVPPLCPDTRGPPGNPEATWVERGAAGQIGSPRQGRCVTSRSDLCHRIRHQVQEGGFATAFSYMKTTVEIPDSLLQQAKRVAAQEHTTVRALVEEGLRRIMAERKRGSKFKLRKASFKGNGLQLQMAGAS